MKKLLDKAIIGFKLNHPDEDVSQELSEIILDEINGIIIGCPKEDDIIYYLSEEDNFFASSLRKELQDYHNQRKNISLSKQILEIIYNDYLSRLDTFERFRFSRNYAIFKSENTINIIGHIDSGKLSQINSLIEKLKDSKDMKVIFYEIRSPGKSKIDDIDVEVDKEGNIEVATDEVKYGTIEINASISSVKNYRLLTHDLAPILINLLSNNPKEKENLINILESIDRDLILQALSELFKKYIDNIDITEVLKENGLKISEKAYEILTNATSIKLLDTINGNLLNGRIELSTNRGYQSKPERPQQDAALSIIKNENCFLNVIADGAGGSENGENASKLFIEEIKTWFEILPDEILNDINLVIKLLKYKVTQIDNLIAQKYKNSYTTMVLALTIKDKTIIANVGDSTAYTYDKENDKLIKLTTLDSDSKGLSYEEIRYSIYNNMITAAIGSGYNDKVHINIINNIGQKIILSSDGITDLVSEERFKTYFKENIHTSQMVEDALSKKDTEWLSKTEDNISVIAINLPDYKKNKIITK